MLCCAAVVVVSFVVVVVVVVFVIFFYFLKFSRFFPPAVADVFRDRSLCSVVGLLLLYYCLAVV